MANISPSASRSRPRSTRVPLRYHADLETVLLVQNIHCPSCVSYVQDILRPFDDVTKVDVNILSHEVRVQHTDSKAKDFASALIDAAFDVHHVSTYGRDGSLLEDFAPNLGLTQMHRSGKSWNLLMSRAQKRHIANCEACQKESKRSSKRPATALSAFAWKFRHGSRTRPKSHPGLDDIESQQGRREKAPQASEGDVSSGPDDRPPSEQTFEAHLSIEGMTCASCSGKITEELESLDFVTSVSINLISNSGTVQYRGSHADANKLVDAIEDIGYEASVIEVRGRRSDAAPSQEDKNSIFTVTLSIEGMTCGSCVATITRGLEELPFARSVNIDLLGNSGKIEFEGESNADKILETIDDLGYDADIISRISVNATEEQVTEERVITLVVEGMYCHHCPKKIEAALNAAIGKGKVLQAPSLSEPHVTVKYTPSPPLYTMRTFMDAIKEADEAFRVEVYHTPSLEERSRKMQKREQWRIMARLVFAGIVAIPTFIIGIVYMSLVPRTNSGRMWLEQPVWSGAASRTEWALFIMTTPVMFFGADYFHTRTFKEIRALWRPSSKVPILRRFYRFGSMNLLISSGTAVAYFASIAVLGLDAKAERSSTAHSNNTYFDSVTFLTFFILIGKFLEAYSKAKTGDAISALSNLRPTEADLVTSVSGEGSTKITKIGVDMLEVGDVVSIPHGTSPPSDGAILSTGEYRFDESSLTGESAPVKKTAGDKVFTGSVNVGSPVQISVTEIGGDSMLDQIVSVVREGQTKRAPIERVADLLTGYFVPIITLLAITSFIIWVALGESGTLPRRYLNHDRGGWVFWSLEFAIAVFVVACPCGIGLAAPTALFVGGGLAAKRGILVQGGGEAFQEASNINVIVFDKTGTLTEGGSLKVTEYEVLEQTDQVDIDLAFKMAQVMEESSNHPIAKAVVDFCKGQQGTSADLVSSEISEVSGQGMSAKFTVKINDERQTYEAAIGNQRLLSSLPNFDTTKDVYLKPILSKYQSLGHSTTIFALRRLEDLQSSRPSASSEETLFGESPAPFKPLLIFAISDPIRPSSLPVLNALREKHNISVHMCTGDNHTTAHAVASQLGIPATNVRANCLPADKAAYIQELQGVSSHMQPLTAGTPEKLDHPAPAATRNDGTKNRKIVAFVGDGTNDTPALSASDVSIALSSGSDVAITTASFILLSPSSPSSSSSPSSPTPTPTLDLHTILSLILLAKRVFTRVKLNFLWAGIYNILLVPVAAGVFFRLGDLSGSGTGWRLGPVWASAAMAASSVSVVLSSLSLRWGEEWREGKKGKRKEMEGREGVTE